MATNTAEVLQHPPLEAIATPESYRKLLDEVRTKLTQVPVNMKETTLSDRKEGLVKTTWIKTNLDGAGDIEWVEHIPLNRRDATTYELRRISQKEDGGSHDRGVRWQETKRWLRPSKVEGNAWSNLTNTSQPEQNEPKTAKEIHDIVADILNVLPR
jgi:hypothetical protein